MDNYGIRKSWKYSRVYLKNMYFIAFSMIIITIFYLKQFKKHGKFYNVIF